MSKITELMTGYNALVDQMNQMDVDICKALTERLLRFLRTVKVDPGITNEDVQGAIDRLDDARPPFVRDWRLVGQDEVVATVRYGLDYEFHLELGPQLLRDDADVAFAELAAEVAARVAEHRAKAVARAKYHEQARLARERQQLDALLLKFDLVAVPAPKDAA